MKNKIFVFLALLAALVVIVGLMKLLVGLTMWLAPIIFLATLAVLAVYFLRRAGVLKKGESISDGLKRFVEYLNG